MSEETQTPDSSTANSVPPWLIRRHREVLVVSSLVILAALVLQVGGEERVFVHGLEGLPLPPLCLSKAWFGIDCPACGLTRSIVLFAHGRIEDSLDKHRLGWLMAVLIAAQIPYRILALRRPDRRMIPSWLSKALLYSLIVLFLGNWLLKFFL